MADLKDQHTMNVEALAAYEALRGPVTVKAEARYYAIECASRVLQWEHPHPLYENLNAEQRRVVDCITDTVLLRETQAIAWEQERRHREEQVHGKMFRTLDGPSIPWAVIAPFEKQCQQNHRQSVERLHQRGGLGVHEVLLVLHDLRAWDNSPEETRIRALTKPEAIKELLALVKERT